MAETARWYGLLHSTGKGKYAIIPLNEGTGASQLVRACKEAGAKEIGLEFFDPSGAYVEGEQTNTRFRRALNLRLRRNGVRVVPLEPDRRIADFSSLLTNAIVWGAVDCANWPRLLEAVAKRLEGTAEERDAARRYLKVAPLLKLIGKRHQNAASIRELRDALNYHRSLEMKARADKKGALINGVGVQHALDIELEFEEKPRYLIGGPVSELEISKARENAIARKAAYEKNAGLVKEIARRAKGL